MRVLLVILVNIVLSLVAAAPPPALLGSAAFAQWVAVGVALVKAAMSVAPLVVRWARSEVSVVESTLLWVLSTGGRAGWQTAPDIIESSVGVGYSVTILSS